MSAAITVYTAAGMPTQLSDIQMVAGESKLIELSPLLLAAGPQSAAIRLVEDRLQRRNSRDGRTTDTLSHIERTRC